MHSTTLFYFRRCLKNTLPFVSAVNRGPFSALNDRVTYKHRAVKHAGKREIHGTHKSISLITISIAVFDAYEKYKYGLNIKDL